MTTVYFINWILVVCVALDSNKNLQKSHMYKKLILIIFFLLFLNYYFYNKMYFSPIECFHHTMQRTDKTNITLS